MNRYKYIDEEGEHMHTLDGAPLIGTSSVSDVLKKDGLTWWASGLAVKEFGCPDGKLLTKINNKKATEEEEKIVKESLAERLHTISNMSLDEYFDVVNRAYRAHQTSLKDSAKDGTDLHAELERFVKWHMSDEQTREEGFTILDEKILPFVEWTRTNIKRFLWSEMHCYSEKYYVGGISDCGYEKHDGTIGIMDFKSSKDAYLSQFFQCAGYAIEIEENGGYDKDGNKVFDLEGKKIQELAVFPFGMEKPEPKFYVDIDKAKNCFAAEVLLYKNINIEQ